MPKSLFGRIIVRLFFIGLYGFIALILFVAGIYGAFQIPAVSGWFFKTMLTAGWTDFPALKPTPLDSDKIPALTVHFEPQPETAQDLFQWDRVWHAHLHFSSNQWQQLSPQKIPKTSQPLSPKMTLRNPNASRAGLLGVLGWDLPWSSAETFHFNGQTFTNLAARYKGNGTFLESKQNYKRSFKLDLNDIVDEQRLAQEGTVNFHNLLADRSRLNDTLGYRYFGKINIPHPHTSYVELTLEIDQVLPPSTTGLYLMVQKPNARWLEAHFGIKGGAVLKPVTLELLKDLGNDWASYETIYDPKTKLSEEQKAHIIETAKWLTTASKEERSAHIQRYFDIDSVARFFAGQVLLSNYDGILFNGQNFLMTLAPETNLISFAPWDMDHSWGEFPLTGTLEQRIHASIHHPWIGDNFFVEKLFQTEVFTERYFQEIKNQLEQHFVEETLFQEIDHLADRIRPSIQKESKRLLEKFEISITTDAQPAHASGNPMDPNRPVHQIKRFIKERRLSVQAQLDGEEKGEIISFDF